MLSLFYSLSVVTSPNSPMIENKSIFMPDFPQSETAATHFYDSGGSLGEELGDELGEIFWAFSCFICCAE